METTGNGKDKNEKRRPILRRLSSKKFPKNKGRVEGLRSALSKDEGELTKEAATANQFVAQSGRMLGCKEDIMAFFERDEFELEQFADVHMQTLTEKGIGNLKSGLATLQQKCEDEAQSAIHGSYSVFVDACNGIAEVDAQFQHLRVLVTGTASLANELKRAVQSQQPTRPTGDLVDGNLLSTSRELSNTTHIRVLTILEELDVAIAERDFPLAKKLLLDIDKEIDAIEVVGDLLTLESSVDKRRQIVVQLLESQLQDPTLGSQDRNTLLQILSSVAGDVYALSFLLSLHAAQINNDWQQMPKPHRTGESENEGADYAGSLSQCSFHGIGLAVEDFRAVFGTSSGHLCSILTQWTDAEARKCAEAVQTHALSGFAELSSTIASVSITLIYAQALKNSHSIDTTTTVRKVIWPTIENRIEQYFSSTADELTVTIREEMSILMTTSSPWDRQASPSSMDSAQMIIDRVHYLTSILRPLWSLHLVGVLRNGIRLLLSNFINTLSADLHEKTVDGVASHTIDRIAEWLMTLIADLIEDQLPKELHSIENKIGSILTKRELRITVEKAAQNLGMEETSTV